MHVLSLLLSVFDCHRADELSIVPLFRGQPWNWLLLWLSMMLGAAAVFVAVRAARRLPDLLVVFLVFVWRARRVCKCKGRVKWANFLTISQPFLMVAFSCQPGELLGTQPIGMLISAPSGVKVTSYNGREREGLRSFFFFWRACPCHNNESARQQQAF